MRSFPSIRLEGGLLAPDLLDELLDARMPGQRPADFRLDGKRSLTEEIAALFSDARTLWSVFQHRVDRLPPPDPATSSTRDAWVIPFLGLLGYELKFNPRAQEVDDLTFAVSHRAGEREDSPPVHIVGIRQDLGRIATTGRPRLAPHSLLQEFLNRTEHVWGLVTNGATLRLLRDSTFVRRQAYIEFDLAAMLEEQRFEDFAALYRLLHRTRLPAGTDDASTCLLEQYFTHSLAEGGRVREHLRDGVERCLDILANGFLSHPGNEDLRRKVAPSAEDARLTPEELYRQLLRVVYRMLFLLVAEERGLLSSDPIYRNHYSISRLRRLLDARVSVAAHDDVWQSLRVLWKVLRDDRLSPVLGLPALNGELFELQALDDCAVSNQTLLEGFWYLAWYQETAATSPRRVNYAALGVEELGSVYESLLEYHPDMEFGGRAPVFRLIAGSDRKTTGSYYTPPQLVAELVRSALEPVIQERLGSRPRDRERALLSIRVCDPACGSGHFLLAAARRLGKELAVIRTGEDEPPPELVREAMRDVISHCVYGVDRNPLAVDLCRVALWIESHSPDKPLTFLDDRIRVGDSLIGVSDLAVLKEGIPDKAFSPLEGDDPELARGAARRNRDERTGQRTLFGWEPAQAVVKLADARRELDGIRSDTPEAIRRKRELFSRAQDDPTWLRDKEACDLWTAAFLQSFAPGALPITSGVLADHLAGQRPDGRILAAADVLSFQQRFFHWPLEFPAVFADGGFDVVLSNPPWEHVELKEQEFFAARDTEIARAANKAERSRLIRALKARNPGLYAAYMGALRGQDAARLFLAGSGRYPLTGRGRINTYAVFAEFVRQVLRVDGRAGIIVPSGIATDDTTKYFFQDLTRTQSLVSLLDFENRKKIFPAIDSRMKFSLTTFVKEDAESRRRRAAQFVFFALDADDLRRPEKRFSLTDQEIALLNPNTGNCPIFRTQADAELTKAIYRRIPVLWREAAEGVPEHNPWRLRFSQGLFNMASDSHHFRTASELRADGYRLEGNIFVSAFDRYLPLYEAKMIHQFDHRWATYESGDDARDVTVEEKRHPSFVAQPRYWVREEVVESAIPKFPEPLALALEAEHRPSVRRVLNLWAAGHCLNQGNRDGALAMLSRVEPEQLEKRVASAIGTAPEEVFARQIDQEFPLDAGDARAIANESESPESLARRLLDRFSPKWFLGWRDITNATNERTLIASAVPRVAVGDTFLLMFVPCRLLALSMCLLANLDSFVADYVARQKVGGTHLKYNVFRQLAVLEPSALPGAVPWSAAESVSDWVTTRALELACTASELAVVVKEVGLEQLSLGWDASRRFEIRCELDAAFFHLYLPAEADGSWRRASDDPDEHLADLLSHFPTPRHAAAYILDQFPIVRQKDERTHGSYRTKERILTIYDEMLVAQRTGRPYRTSLKPPPGEWQSR